MSKRYILKTDTNWCGEDTSQGVITNNVDSLHDLFQIEAYDRFMDFGGFDTILEDMFPDTDDYTDEQRDEVAEVESEYYSYTIEEFDEETHGEWDWYDLFLDDTE